MGLRWLRLAIEIREGPRDTERSIDTASRETPCVKGRKRNRGGIGWCRRADPRGWRMGVRPPWQIGETRAGPLSRLAHARCNRRTGLATWLRTAAHWHHVNLEIDAVKERAPEAPKVAPPL